MSLLVHVIKENVVALVDTAHDVLHRPGIFKSNLARHVEELDQSGRAVNLKSRAFLRSDPADFSPQRF
jgi:hypothetical protein